MANLEKSAQNVASKAKSQAHQSAGYAKDQYESGMQAASGLVADAREFIQDEMPDYVKHALADIRESAQKAVDASKSTVTKYPVYSIIGAVAAGAVLGMLLGRSRK